MTGTTQGPVIMATGTHPATHTRRVMAMDRDTPTPRIMAIPTATHPSPAMAMGRAGIRRATAMAAPMRALAAAWLPDIIIIQAIVDAPLMAPARGRHGCSKASGRIAALASACAVAGAAIRRPPRSLGTSGVVVCRASRGARALILALGLTLRQRLGPASGRPLNDSAGSSTRP
jgi:hypothetical protein